MEKSIQDFWWECKEYCATYSHEIFTVCVLVFIASASFGLGRLSVIREVPAIRFDVDETMNVAATANGANAPQGNFVASVSGSKYHLPECPGAQSIKEENKIWFDTPKEAEAAGYRPALNCPGISGR